MMALSAGLVAVMVSALIMCLQGIGATDKNQHEKIIGGKDANRGQFPWQVLIYSYDTANDTAALMCGGSVIDAYWVLTAAHCIWGEISVLKFGTLLSDQPDLSDMSEPGSVLVGSKTHFVHELFKVDHTTNEMGLEMLNDIALIRLVTPLTFSDTIRPVKLPRRSQQYKTFDGETVIASGWGHTNFTYPAVPDFKLSATLKYVDLEILDDHECREIHFICTNVSSAKSALQGDSGGALVWKDEAGEFLQIGIASQVQVWMKNSTETGLLFNNEYTFVPDYLDWIADKTGIKITD